MFKKLVLLFVVLAALMVSAGPALGLQNAAILYVDKAYVGPEDGSQAKPYNTIEEATAVGQSLPSGADIYQKQSDGSWKYVKTVPPVHPGGTGIPLAGPVLFGLLVAFSLILILAGLVLRRRSQILAR